MWVSVCLEWAWLITVAAQHLHCRSQANSVVSQIVCRKIQAQEDITQDPGLWRSQALCAPLKPVNAEVLRNLGETEIHTSQPEPLPVTSLNIQTQKFLAFISLLCWGSSGSPCSSQQVWRWGSIQEERGQAAWFSWGRDRDQGRIGSLDYQTQTEDG